MRTCKDCGEKKPIKEFASAGIIKGVQYYRKRCVKCYSKFKQIRKDRLHEQYFEFKKTLSCVECGNDDFRVLEFDHLDPACKSFNVSEGLQKGFAFAKIEAEIDKCQVLCANCHRIKTYEERQCFRV